MNFKTLSVASSLAIMAGMSAPAFAQDENAVDETGARNTEIVVTAEFREARLQDTPIAITAVNAEMLEARGQTDISQIAAQAPNVSLRPQGQGGGTGLIAFIRGVGQVDFNYALDPGVGVYVDDVFIPTLSSSLLELMDLERVEVLRGPQGTLAGKNSIGGAIKLFSQRPDGSGEGSLRVEYGSYDLVSIRGMADIAISDNMALRVSGMSRSRDGYVALLDYAATHPNSNVRGNGARGRGNADYESMGGESLVAGRAALRWEASDMLEINISGDYTREDSEAGANVLIAAGNPVGPGVSSDLFNPVLSNPNPSVEHDGTPWLVGKDGTAVRLSCAFVPAGQYSCDTGGNLLGYDPRFVSYATFADASEGNAVTPYKPYFALPITEFEGYGIHGNLTLDLSENLQVVYIGSYRAYTSKFGVDQDNTPIPVSQLDNQLEHEAWSSEVRVNFELADGLLEGTVGGYYLDQNGTYTARVDLNYVNPTIDFIHGPDSTPSTTKAVFGTLTVRPTDSLSITGGLRYTKDKKVYTYFRSNPDGTIPGTASSPCPAGPPFAGPNCILTGLFNVPGAFEGDRFDWRIVGDYRVSDSLLVYASVATGFKGGGVNPRPFVADQADPFSPETLTTYEVGFKSDFWDRRVRLNGSAFFNKYEDIILGQLICPESALPSPCLKPANVGSADVQGLELELGLYPVDGLSIDGSISMLDFEYTSSRNAGGFLTTIARDSSGNPILVAGQPQIVATTIAATNITPYTPELTYSFGIQYDAEVGSGTLSARFDGSFQDEVFSNSENTSWGKIDGRFLGNGRLSYTSGDEAWRVSLEVQNIFDKYYFLNKQDATANSLGTVTGTPALPRTWSLAVERRF